MTKTLDQAIDEIVADIAKLEAQIREKKTTVNTLCGVASRPLMYQIDAPEVAAPTRIRSDQFYGQPLASAVRTVLEMRKQQNLGAAQVGEIYDALIRAAIIFRQRTRRSRVSRCGTHSSKNTVTFHKLPGGRFGLLSWYPNAKSPKSNTTATTVTGDFEPEAETDTGADEPAPVIPQ